MTARPGMRASSVQVILTGRFMQKIRKKAARTAGNIWLKD